MSQSANTIGIRLAGPVVRCEDGRVVTIPWEFVAGSSTRMRTTEAARLIHPGVPERLVGLRGVGTATIDGLQARALARRIRSGMYARTWKAAVFLNGVQLGVMFAFLTLGAIGVQLGLFQFLLVDDPAYADVRDIKGVSKAIAVTALVIGGVAALVAALRGWWDRRPTVVALRARSQGIDWVLNTGREMFEPWSDVRGRSSREVNWPSPPDRVRYSGQVIERDEFALFRAAADSLGLGSYTRQGPPHARMVGRTQIRRKLRNLVSLTAVFGALMAANIAVGSYANVDENPYKRPLPPGVAAAVASMLLLGLSSGYGFLLARMIGTRNVVRALKRIGGRTAGHTY